MESNTEILKENIESRMMKDHKNTYSINGGHRMFDARNFSLEDNDDGDIEGMDKSDIVNSKTINDILKYGAHQSADSNPVETQSEWSDEGDDDEAKGKKYRLFF